MIKAAVVISAILMLAGVAAASTFTGVSPSSETPTLSIPNAASTGGTTTNDDTTTAGTTTGEDISGPCDEAEHANEPRCTGVGAAQANRGDDNRHDDRSGPNRGPGRGDDNDDDDNSGPGNAHDDDDSSGDDDSLDDSGDDDSGHGGDDD